MMPDFYLETHFYCDDLPVDGWPKEFVIITAYATTGESWTPAVNREADACLLAHVKQHSDWHWRITGYSPTSGHAEPGWAVELDFNAACDLGREFKQDAIYHVSGDVLSVSYCDHRRALYSVGTFRDRVTVRAVGN